MINRLYLLICLFFICSCSKEDLYSENCDDIEIRPNMRISILGDSYSTFQGFLFPDGNPSYYPSAELGVTDVTQTWWQLFIDNLDLDLNLECNNSYSGSTIAIEGDKSSSYVERCKELGNPDIIFVFGATNDSWLKVPMGDFQYEEWTDKDLCKFRPAFACLLFRLQSMYPRAKIINMINTDLKKEYKSSMEIICRYYNICNISLGDFDKKDSHPTKNGMNSIYRQLYKTLVK